MSEIKKEIEKLLRSTKRQGIEDLLRHMEEIGFYESPSSTHYHLAEEGGLAKHSLNVLKSTIEIRDALCADISNDSIYISALLHDIGKCGDHGKRYYEVNLIKDGRVRKSEPEQKFKQSESKPYKTNKELPPIPHEIRSYAIAGRYIQLTEEEEFAILYHNGMYSALKYELQGNETPLFLLIHSADMWASRVLEKEE